MQDKGKNPSVSGLVDNGRPHFPAWLPARWTIRILAFSGLFIAIVAGALLATGQFTAKAQDEPVPLECLSCHTRTMIGHDKLGEGSDACRVCHDPTKMGTLRLFDNTDIPMADSVPLCRQCHSQKYQEWSEGNHGVVHRNDGTSSTDGGVRLKCALCHLPHAPKIDVTVLQALPPTPELSSGLDCLQCHVRQLKAHDVLGAGSEACRTCHSPTTMGKFHLASGGEEFGYDSVVKLCAQCHQDRYNDWLQGFHGAPAWQEGQVEIHGEKKVNCLGCHDPHQPQIVLLNITKPHPDPVPAPPSPEVNPLMIFGIALLTTAGVGVVMATRGEGS